VHKEIVISLCYAIALTDNCKNQLHEKIQLAKSMPIKQITCHL